MKLTHEKLLQCEKILEERGGEYGNGGNEIKKIVTSFNAMSGKDLEPHHFVLMMICMKWVRHDSFKKSDNWLDMMGYITLGWDAEDQES